MTIELRRVTAADWRTWRPVRLAALAEAPDAFGSTLADWVDAPEHRWRTRLSLPGGLDLLAFDGARFDGARFDGEQLDGPQPRPVGMASGVPGDEPGTAELISMWVDPSVRGRGVATTLIDAIARWAADSGATTLELSVMPDNVVAQRVYERTGFVASGRPGDELPDGRHELVMRRALRGTPQP
ncbi:N-acetyltransferase [Curtobacterium sp. ISL-83]|uniref:GNAT family N-acetyltransferase n=1 Tax=Curtobacterium sp. ISL-83 TaxID=2819145 RepID=UPI001BEC6C03|nr:GNAT family N-acetyltransferase [Curtobacterium sp. ISL-83]MBT2502036.1 GNAT family N-acetyltransferase [Curtobacterium sp. ISL-83]